MQAARVIAGRANVRLALHLGLSGPVEYLQKRLSSAVLYRAIYRLVECSRIAENSGIAYYKLKVGPGYVDPCLLPLPSPYLFPSPPFSLPFPSPPSP